MTTALETPTLEFETTKSEAFTIAESAPRTKEFQRIAIVGMGYVGLPLAIHFARAGLSVTGLDIDAAKVDAINQGESYIKHIPAADLRKQVTDGRFSASTEFSAVEEMDAVIICVPTPLNKNREPDISYILRTGEAISPHLRRGALVVLESTTFPGTTDENLRQVLEAGSRLVAGRDFHLAYSPEREDPGNPESVVSNIPKIVGGYTPACLAKARRLYGHAIRTVVPVSSCRAAEAVKLLENIFRCVNIALVNELKLVYGAMGIDIWEVIQAAKTKPFGFMPFYPGPGLGGHCIPIDPFYLTWKAREFGQHTRFIELAGEINTAMPHYVVERVSEALNSHRRSIRGSRMLILGLAYKPNVDDDRESPSYHIMDLLKERGAEIGYFDPHVPVIRPNREHNHWANLESIAWSSATVSKFDVAVICTAHDAVNYEELADWASLIVDTRNVLANVRTKPGQVWKA
jgi:UDP-N-acetyl-D-glucosamine dehydrogenase